MAPEPDSSHPEVFIPLGDDQVVYIPFGQNDNQEDRTFTFFGKEYTGLYYSSNGFIQFVESEYEYVSSGCCSGYPLPVSNRAIIGGYWSDLLGERAQLDYLVTINPFPIPPSYKYPDYPPKNSYQHFKTDEDEDILKLTWSNIIHYSDLYVSLYNAAASFEEEEKFNTFHIYLNFNTREVTIHCESCTTNGSPHTQGISFNSQFQYIPGRSSRSWSISADVVLFTSDAVEAEGGSQAASNNISCQLENDILNIENIVSIEDTDDNQLTLQCIPTNDVGDLPENTTHIKLGNSENNNRYYIKTSMIESP